jgi:hypothetical protein
MRLIACGFLWSAYIILLVIKDHVTELSKAASFFLSKVPLKEIEDGELKSTIRQYRQGKITEEFAMEFLMEVMDVELAAWMQENKIISIQTH